MLLLTLLALATSSLDSVKALPIDEEKSSLHGWMGEATRSKMMPEQSRKWLEVLSWPDRVFVVHNMLSQGTPNKCMYTKECNHLIERARPRLTRSGVVDAKRGAGSVSDVRTSHGTFFGRGETQTISLIEERLSEWVMVDKGQAEGFQVLHYKVSEKYDPHFDYFFHDGGTANGGNRLLTILIYLSDVEEGGETVFPNIPAPPGQNKESFSECAMQGLAVKPKMGDAVIFWSLKTSGELNPGSMHGSCPVISGEKFSATKWYHVGHYASPGQKAVGVEHVVFAPPPPPTPPGCLDDEKACKGWAAAGECIRNAGFMIGSEQTPGVCLKSCGRCDLMPYKHG